jgi:hypothetical protein
MTSSKNKLQRSKDKALSSEQSHADHQRSSTGNPASPQSSAENPPNTFTDIVDGVHDYGLPPIVKGVLKSLSDPNSKSVSNEDYSATRRILIKKLGVGVVDTLIEPVWKLRSSRDTAAIQAGNASGQDTTRSSLDGMEPTDAQTLATQFTSNNCAPFQVKDKYLMAEIVQRWGVSTEAKPARPVSLLMRCVTSGFFFVYKTFFGRVKKDHDLYHAVSALDPAARVNIVDFQVVVAVNKFREASFGTFDVEFELMSSARTVLNFSGNAGDKSSPHLVNLRLEDLPKLRYKTEVEAAFAVVIALADLHNWNVPAPVLLSDGSDPIAWTITVADADTGATTPLTLWGELATTLRRRLVELSNKATSVRDVDVPIVVHHPSSIKFLVSDGKYTIVAKAPVSTISIGDDVL